MQRDLTFQQNELISSYLALKPELKPKPQQEPKPEPQPGPQQEPEPGPEPQQEPQQEPGPESEPKPKTFVNPRLRRLPMDRKFAKGRGLHYIVQRPFNLILRLVGQEQNANSNERQMMQNILFDPHLKDDIFKIIKSEKWIKLVQKETRDKRKMKAIRSFVIQMERQFLEKYHIKDQAEVQCSTQQKQQKQQVSFMKVQKNNYQINVQCDSQQKEQKQQAFLTREDNPEGSECHPEICQIDSLN